MKPTCLIVAVLMFLGMAGMTFADLIAHYTFDVETGSTTVPDLSGNGFDMTVGVDGAIVTGGKFGNCLRNTDGYDATQGAVGKVTSIGGTDLETAFTGDFTVEAWFKFNGFESGTDWAHLFAIGNSGSNSYDAVKLVIRCPSEGSKWSLQIDDTPSPWQYQGGTHPFTETTNWHHIALTYDASTDDAIIWADGSLSVTATDITSGNGCNGFSANEAVYALTTNVNNCGFNGYIDEMRISDEVVYTSSFTPPANKTDVGDNKQLFLDDTMVASTTNVSRKLNFPTKMGAMMDSGDESWEDEIVGPFSVIQDDDLLPTYTCRIYYNAVTTGASDIICMAQSLDGEAWTKPALGKVTISGNNTNALYVDSGIGSVYYDDNETSSSKRYKLFRAVEDSGTPANNGIFASYSSNGVDFTSYGRVLPMFTDGSIDIVYDEAIDAYNIFMTYIESSERKVGMIQVDDLLSDWPYRGTVTTTLNNNHVIPAFENDASDPPNSDVYMGGALHYPGTRGLYLMFPTMRKLINSTRDGWFDGGTSGTDYGLCEVQMAYSRDGLSWTRAFRDAPYIPMGHHNEWDRWMVQSGTGQIRMGNDIYHYYFSPGEMEGGASLRSAYSSLITPKPSIGLIKQRLDGFASMDATWTDGGYLTTPVFKFSGNYLRVNYDAGTMGSVYVEIQNSSGTPYASYTLAKSRELCGSAADEDAHWNTTGTTYIKTVSSLAGTDVKLKFKLTYGAKLYSFQFIN